MDHQQQTTPYSFKVHFNKEVRRWMWNAEFNDLSVLRSYIDANIPKLQGREWTLTWTDEEGDQISIVTNDDLRVAVTTSFPSSSGSTILNLSVRRKWNGGRDCKKENSADTKDEAHCGGGKWRREHKKKMWTPEAKRELRANCPYLTRRREEKQQQKQQQKQKPQCYRRCHPFVSMANPHPLAQILKEAFVSQQQQQQQPSFRCGRGRFCGRNERSHGHHGYGHGRGRHGYGHGHCGRRFQHQQQQQQQQCRRNTPQTPFNDLVDVEVMVPNPFVHMLTQIPLVFGEFVPQSEEEQEQEKGNEQQRSSPTSTSATTMSSRDCEESEAAILEAVIRQSRAEKEQQDALRASAVLREGLAEKLSKHQKDEDDDDDDDDDEVEEEVEEEVDGSETKYKVHITLEKENEEEDDEDNEKFVFVNNKDNGDIVEEDVADSDNDNDSDSEEGEEEEEDEEDEEEGVVQKEEEEEEEAENVTLPYPPPAMSYAPYERQVLQLLDMGIQRSPRVLHAALSRNNGNLNNTLSELFSSLPIEE
eukprot:m.165089 g.165089  ORF g.165089 m.165089 type:complete len:532 (+) comp13433_c0_seq4:576-2171(+)